MLAMWHDTLAATIDRRDVHGQLVGRMARLLHDATDWTMSPFGCSGVTGADAAAKAACGRFFADGALLLIHDHELRSLLEFGFQGLASPSSSICYRWCGGASRLARIDGVASASDCTKDRRSPHFWHQVLTYFPRTFCRRMGWSSRRPSDHLARAELPGREATNTYRPSESKAASARISCSWDPMV